MTGEPRSIERTLWVDETIADHIPYTGDDQNQTTGRCFEEVVYVLCKLRVEKLRRGLVDITSLDLLVARVYEWSHLGAELVKYAWARENAPTRRTTPGFRVIKLFNNVDHGLN